MEAGGEAAVVQELGRGGQGIVYLVRYKGREYALRDVIRNVEDEISGRNRTADPESDWRVFCRSFCLTEYEPDGKTELPDLLPDTPMELQITLTDCTNDAESLIELHFPAK